MGQEKSKAAREEEEPEGASTSHDNESTDLGEEYDIEDQAMITSAYTPSEGSKKATQRLISDLKEATKKSHKKEGILVSPVNDNLYKWHVKFKEFPAGTTIAQDMEYLQSQTGKDHILLEIIFSKKYPDSPPFMRVVYPRLQQYTGHVTIGGSICVETLTKSGWSSKFSLPAFLIMIRQLLVEGGASINRSKAHDSYSEAEAKSAFLRVAKQHHWKT